MSLRTDKFSLVDNECAICNELLKYPKRLSCSHKYCELCINTWISKSETTSGVECPLCRKVTPPPKPDLDAASWASMLPDYVPERESHGVLCQPCESTQERNVAKFYCLECGEYMCIYCHVSHTKLKVSRSHRTIELGLCESESEKSFKEYSLLLMCDVHPEKEIEFYCEDDDSVVCSTCAFLHHRSCESVTEIKADFAEIKEVKPLPAISKNLQTIREMVEEIVEFYKNNNEILERNEKALMLELAATKQNIMKSFEKFHAKVKIQLQEKNRSHKVTNDVKLRECNKIIENLKSVEKTTKDTMGMTSGRPEYVIVSRRLEEKYNEIKDQVKREASTLNTFSRYKFEFKSDFVESLKKIETYGCYMEERCGDQSLVSRFSATKNKTNFVLVRPKPISKKSKRQTSYFPSACFMNDDKEERVVLAEQNKKRLVILSRNGITDDVKLTFIPYAVVFIKKSLYISFPHEKMIRKYDTALSFKQIAEIRTKHMCYAIDYLSKKSEDKIVVSLCNKESWNLAVYALDGDKFTCLSEDYSHNYFASLWYFKILDGNLFFSCQEENCVKAMNLESSNFLFKYESRELQNPGGIGIDSEENIYICGISSANIHVLSRKGKLIRIVKLDEDFVPTFISFSDNSEDLVILGNANNPGPFFYQLK